MKINPSNESGQSMPQTQKTGTPSSRTEGFQTVLGNAMDRTGSRNKPAGTGTQALGEIPSRPISLAHASPADVSARTTRLLDMLDQYAGRLQDPGLSLKQIEPAMEDMQRAAADLLASAEKDPELNTNLKRIARETALTANREYLKFQRGDYLA